MRKACASLLFLLCPWSSSSLFSVCMTLLARQTSSLVLRSAVRRRLTLSSTVTTSEAGVVAPSPSRIAQVRLRGFDFDVKRDDSWKLLGDLGAGISGNKARKLYRFAVEGPRAPTVASIGGHQSNAMLAIAALCRARGTTFVYLAKPVPRWLRGQPAGNYARALALGMRLAPLDPRSYARALGDAAYRAELLEDLALSHREDEDGRVEWVPQGGACADAEVGMRMLAEELQDQYSDLSRTTVVLPAGTGTTALFLARHLSQTGARVAAVPCATSGEELRRQMTILDRRSGSVGIFPGILTAPPRQGEPKHRFAQPAKRDIDLWAELRESGLYVDLLYAPYTWDTLMRHLGLDADHSLAEPSLLLKDRHVVYLHCGGLEGVATQLTRYRHAGIPIPETL